MKKSSVRGSMASLVTMDSKEWKHSLLTIDVFRVRVKYTSPALEFVFGHRNSGSHCLNGTFCYRRWCSFRVTVRCRKYAGPRHEVDSLLKYSRFMYMLILLISDAERMKVYVLAEEVTEAKKTEARALIERIYHVGRKVSSSGRDPR